LLGLAFKPGTDDLRESPLVALAERLLGKGCRLRIHDREVSLARLVGANRAYIEREIPHLGELLTSDLREALAGARVVVVGALAEEDVTDLAELITGRTVVALREVPEPVAARARAVLGICW
jgi:GDP-mannose 6-dehydrogenase